MSGLGTPLRYQDDQLNGLGEGLDGSAYMVDWDGSGRRDILYTTSPRGVGGGTFLYLEDRTASGAEPVYREGIRLSVDPCKWIAPLGSDCDGCVMLLALTPSDELIVFQAGTDGASPGVKKLNHQVTVSGEGLRAALSDYRMIDVRPIRLGAATHLVAVCVKDSTKYWPDRKSGWYHREHPNLGYGRGYDANGVWKGTTNQFDIYILRSNEKPNDLEFLPPDLIGEYESLYSIDATFADVDADGEPELVVRDAVDRVLFSKLVDGRACGDWTELACSPLERLYAKVSFWPCDIDGDGRDELLLTGNPGCVVWLDQVDGHWRERALLRKVGGEVRTETLSVPCLADLDGDGDLDLVVGDSSGFLWHFENLTGERDEFCFAQGRRLRTPDGLIRHQAGYSGSIQGPAEARWGYTNPLLVDWDGDGLCDIVTNDVTGSFTWYRNVGSRTGLVLDSPRALMLNGQPFVGAWRSRPALWEDGVLIVVNIDGFLQFVHRSAFSPTDVMEGIVLRYVDGCGIRGCGPSGFWGRTVLYACDWDDDGRLDLIAGYHKDLAVYFNGHFPEAASACWMRNVGTNNAPVFERPRLITLKDGTPINLGAHKCSPWCVDVDGDGRLDLVSGAEDGKIYYWLRKDLRWDWDPGTRFDLVR